LAQETDQRLAGGLISIERLPKFALWFGQWMMAIIGTR
jgi:hypothetical protein